VYAQRPLERRTRGEWTRSGHQRGGRGVDGHTVAVGEEDVEWVDAQRRSGRMGYCGAVL
jgi:hypothetical protein